MGSRDTADALAAPRMQDRCRLLEREHPTILAESASAVRPRDSDGRSRYSPASDHAPQQTAFELLRKIDNARTSSVRDVATPSMVEWGASRGGHSTQRRVRRWVRRVIVIATFHSNTGAGKPAVRGRQRGGVLWRVGNAGGPAGPSCRRRGSSAGQRRRRHRRARRRRRALPLPGPRRRRGLCTARHRRRDRTGLALRRLLPHRPGTDSALPPACARRRLLVGRSRRRPSRPAPCGLRPPSPWLSHGRRPGPSRHRC
jgi:hypothetical protein